MKKVRYGHATGSAGGFKREVLFEFRNVGASTRVVAIDPISNTEIILVGAPGYSEDMLKMVAARKLAYVLAKNRHD